MVLIPNFSLQQLRRLPAEVLAFDLKNWSKKLDSMASLSNNAKTSMAERLSWSKETYSVCNRYCSYDQLLKRTRSFIMATKS